MEDFSWWETGPMLTKAVQLQEQILKMERDLEHLYQERNNLLPNIKGALVSSRNLLKGVFAKNMKKLGDWGFTVDHTPKAKKKVTG